MQVPVVPPRVARLLTAMVLGSSTVALAQEPPAAAPAPEAVAPVVETAPAAPEPPPEPEQPPTPSAPIAVEAAPPPETPAPPPPAAPAPVGLKLTSSFFTRYEGREHFDQLGVAGRFAESDLTVFRSRIGIASTPVDVGEGEQVLIQFTPQASGILGALPGTVTDAALGLHEGYLRIQGDGHRFDAGRFEMNYGDSFIIGSLDWHETARSFDGMRLRLTPEAEKTFVDVFLTLATPAAGAAEAGRPAPAGNPYGNGDSYFTGVYAGLGGFIDPAMELEPYLLANIQTGLTDSTMGTHTNPSTLFTLGTRFKHKLDALDLRAEVGLQVGGRGATGPTGMVPDGSSIFAYQADGEIGYSLADNKLRLAVEGMIASGDDPATADKIEGWNQLYPTAHKFLGLMDVMGARSNVASGVLHVSASPMADVKIMLDAHMFSRLEDAGMRQSGMAGFEVDAGLVYALGAGLNVRGLYGVFVPGKDVYGDDADPAHYVEIELRHDLK